MIPATEQISRLRALLERIQLHAGEPRAPRVAQLVAVEEEQREPTLPGHQAANVAAAELVEVPVEVPIEAAVEVPVEAPVEAIEVAPEELIEPELEAPVVEPAIEAPVVEPAIEVHVAEAAEAPIEVAPQVEAPVEAAVEAAVEEQPLSDEPIELEPIELTPPPIEPVVTETAEERAEAISGEFAVAEMAMELEELGPADEVHEDEHVVEIHVEEPAAVLSPIVEDGRPIEHFVGENAAVSVAADEPKEAEEVEETELGRVSEPPASGRELVATPFESQRMAVAAPATPDPNALELTEEPEAPPESSRNLRAAPAVPQTSDVIELEPSIPRIERIEPIEPPIEQPIEQSFEPAAEQPIEEPIAIAPGPIELEPIAVAFPVEEPAAPIAFEPVEMPAPVEEPAPLEPQRVAVAVSLAASPAVRRPVEHVVVAVDADVIHAELTPADVAAFVGAARGPRPETFGVLLDAALDL